MIKNHTLVCTSNYIFMYFIKNISTDSNISQSIVMQSNSAVIQHTKLASTFSKLRFLLGNIYSLHAGIPETFVKVVCSNNSKSTC